MSIYLSKKGKKILEDRIDKVEKEIIETYKQMGESTKIDNDLRENPEYNDLQNKVSYKLPLEKKQLKETLNNALIIEEQDFYKNFNGNEVVIGTRVTLLYNGNKETYSIVGYGEEDPFENIISYNCDFAINLIGKKINEEYKYKNACIKVLDVKLIYNE